MLRSLAYGVLLRCFRFGACRSGIPDLLAYKLVKSLKNDADIGTQKGEISHFLTVGRLRWHRKCHSSTLRSFLSSLHHYWLFSTISRLDRRAIACVLTFGLVATYMFLPMGFGAIFLNDILAHNINHFGQSYGFHISNDQIPRAMLIPVSGMFAGC